MIFKRHGETANRLAMPALVGEWGAFGHHTGTLPAALGVVRQFEGQLFSDTYWDFDKKLPELDHFKAIHHPYPERLAGTLIRYSYDSGKGLFTCVWQEDRVIDKPTRIYLPDWLKFNPDQVTVTPKAQGFEIVKVVTGSLNSWMIIEPTGKDVERTLIVRSACG